MVRNLEDLGPCLQKIVSRLQSNQDLLKLLYYTDKDPLNNPDLTKEQIKEEIFQKLIKIIPRVGPKETAQGIVSMRVVRGRPNENNDFENIGISFEIFTPLEQWIIKDTSLRPFCIMGEIKKSLSGKKIDGIGKMYFNGFDLNFLTEEISCYEMQFQITNYD